MLSLGFSFLLRGKDGKSLRGLCLYFFILKGAVQNEKLMFVHMKSRFIFHPMICQDSFFVLDEARINEIIWPDISFLWCAPFSCCNIPRPSSYCNTLPLFVFLYFVQQAILFVCQTQVYNTV